MGAVLQTAAKIRSWGGHLELHAISEAYKVNVHAVHVWTRFGQCLEIRSGEGKHTLYLWFQEKHYECLTGSDPGSWIVDRCATGTRARRRPILPCMHCMRHVPILATGPASGNFDRVGNLSDLSGNSVGGNLTQAYICLPRLQKG